MVSPRSDSIPNEANCPVHLEILALLLRSDDATKQALIREIPGPTRARLAFFCYNRVHLRGLAFQIRQELGRQPRVFVHPQRVQRRNDIVCGTSEGANGTTIYRERVC